MTQSERVIAFLLTHPHSSSTEVASGAVMTLKGAAAACTKLHQEGRIRAEAVWRQVKPMQKRSVLLYRVAE